MNTPDDKNVGKSVDELLIEPVRWGRWAVLAVVIVLVGSLATGWLMRKAIAGHVFSSWCESRNLACEGKFTQLGFGGATIRALKISASGDIPLEAQEVTARLGWAGLFTPELTSIAIDKPIVRGTLDDKGVKFYGLEKLASSSSEKKNTELKLPAIDITDGRIFLATDAGELSASVSMNGTFPQKGELDLVLDPASLQTQDSEFQWSEGVISLSAESGRISGGANVVLEQANLKGISVKDALLEMTIDAADVGEGPMQLNWTGSVTEAAFPGGELRAAKTNGSAAFTELPSLTTDAAMAALARASIMLESGMVSYGGYGADSLNLETLKVMVVILAGRSRLKPVRLPRHRVKPGTCRQAACSAVQRKARCSTQELWPRRRHSFRRKHAASSPSQSRFRAFSRIMAPPCGQPLTGRYPTSISQ